MSAPLRVGIDATTWWNDRGFGRFTRELVRALVERRGSRFEYLLFVDHEPDGTLPEGARVVLAPTTRAVTEAAVGSGSRSLSDAWSLRRTVAGEELDAFFFPAVYSYFPLAGRVPCVVTFHDTIAERYPGLIFPTWRNRLLWTVKIRLALWRTQRVMTVSEASARDLVDVLGVDRERIDLVSEAADPRFRPSGDPGLVARVRERHGIPAEAPLLVYVGGLNPHKNLLGLLRALVLLRVSQPELRLAIIGDASGKGFHHNTEELRRFVAANDLERSVQFTGFVSDQELVELYQAATVFVLPSLWEGFGLPAIEAMASGLPVAVSDRGSLPEVVGDAGLLFDPLDAEQVAATLDRLLRDASLRERLAQAGLERAATFTWDRGAQLAEECFRKCAGVRDTD